MAQVMEYAVRIPVLKFSGADLGAEAVQNKLRSMDWAAQATPRHAQRLLEVRVRLVVAKRPSTTDPTATVPVFGPFESSRAQADIESAANSIGAKVASFKEWLVATKTELKDLAPSEIAKTAVKGNKELLQNVKDQGIVKALGLPKWTVPAAIGVGGLFVLVQLANVKKAFLGGLSGRRRRR